MNRGIPTCVPYVVAALLLFGTIFVFRYTSINFGQLIAKKDPLIMETNYLNILSTLKYQHNLLTTDRYNVLRQIVVDRLFGNGDTFNDMFLFLSLLDDNCSSLVIPEIQSFVQSPWITTKMAAFREKLKSVHTVNEGFSEQVTGQPHFYALIARQPWVRQICEIGFNAGHSAFYWLAMNNDTKVLSFDLGIHPYSKPMADFLTSTFPGRIEVVWGDSTKKVPEFSSQTSLTCDIIVIDGGHEYEVALPDLRNMKSFAKSQRHLLIMDDTPCEANYCVGPTKAWRDLRNIIKPLFGCFSPNDRGRGFSVGYYVL